MMKTLRMLACLMLCACVLTGCTAAPTSQPAISLPAPAPGPEAPYGDAGLRHEVIVPLYLPSLDGQNLLTFFETLTLTHDQHPAENILRALLAHEGNSRVRSLGGSVRLTLAGANPAEVSCGVCTVNLSASALLLPSEELYTVAQAITATLSELEDVQYVNLLVAGTPLAMDVSGNLPLGTLTASPGQELPVLWEQFSARRTAVGDLASSTPLTATATLYFPLADGSGVVAEPRRISFPGQHPQQLILSLLDALSTSPTTLEGTADMPEVTSLMIFMPEVTELEGGGRRATLHFTADALDRISLAGCDPACFFASLTTTLTTFVPSLQQVCILLGDGAVTTLYSPALGSLIFPGALHARSSYADAVMSQATLYVPGEAGLAARSTALPYRHVGNPRKLLLHLASEEIGALPAGLTDADVLGLAVKDNTLLVNLSERYGQLVRESAADQRLMAYSAVNTLCSALDVRRLRFYFGGAAVDEMGADLVWSGEFLFNPRLISQ